jgi:hypothetical protein
MNEEKMDCKITIGKINIHWMIDCGNRIGREKYDREDRVEREFCCRGENIFINKSSSILLLKT